MHKTSDGKVRRTEKEWREIAARFHESGLSYREFSRREGVGLVSLQRWCKRLGTASDPFVEILSATPLPTSTPAEPEWLAEIEFPNGCTLRLRA